MKKMEKMQFIQLLMDEVEKYPHRLGQAIYYRVKRNEKYEMMDIDAEDFYNFMNYKLFVERGCEVSTRLWKSATSLLKGKYGNSDLEQLCNRVARIGNDYYFDLLNNGSEEFKYVKFNSEGWEIVEECNAMFSWNPLSLPQTVPSRDKSDLLAIRKFINLDDDNSFIFIVYLISLFIADIQYPILNISGEHGTGKSTISWVLKSLSDPSRDEKISLTSNENDFILPIAKNHTTIYDNTEYLPAKLNSILCQAVTGGQVPRRKLYTNAEQVLVELKSAIVLNGISSVVKKEDLMSRVVFIRTKSNEDFKSAEFNSNNIIKTEFEKSKGVILAGIFDVLVKAINIKPTVKLEKFYRMMDFAEWGYAIAEGIGEGLGERFLEILDDNEKTQLQETYLNEPLITLVCNYMSVNGGDGIHTMTQKFFNDLISFAHNQLGNYDKKVFPKTVAALSKKIRAYKTIFRKLGYDVDIFQSRDKEHISKISITPIADDNIQNAVNEYGILRTPIVGIREPIFLDKVV